MAKKAEDKSIVLKKGEELFYEVESTHRPGDWDPTTRICARVCVMREGPDGKEAALVLGEMDARLFDPYLLMAWQQSDDREPANMFDEHDSLDQDTHELWSAIYDYEDDTQFCSPWDSTIEMPHGAVLVVDCAMATEFEGSRNWLEPLATQVLLDHAERGVNMTLVDLRYLKASYMKPQKEMFAKLGFRPAGKRNTFLVRDPAIRQPRVRLRPETDDDEGFTDSPPNPEVLVN